LGADVDEKKLKAERPELYERLIIRQRISSGLIWLLCLPVTIGITWPLWKRATWNDFQNDFLISGLLFFFLVIFVAINLSRQLAKKMFGEILMQEDRQELSIRARTETQARFETKAYETFSVNWQTFGYKLVVIGQIITLIGIVGIFSFGMPRKPIAYTVAFLVATLPYIKINRDLQFFKTATRRSLLFLVMSILFVMIFSPLFRLPENPLLFSGWAISLIVALFIAERERISTA
jgi:hypothetical protein